MTEIGAPRLPDPAPDATPDAAPAPTAAASGEQPPGPPPALVRAAKLNAANMARSLLPLVLICLVLVGWAAWRQTPDDPVREVDPASSVRVTAERAGFEVLVPTGLPAEFRPTSARTSAGGAEPGDPVTLEIGYLTPQAAFAGFVVSDDDDADPLRRVLEGAEEDGAADLGGRAWTRLTTAEGETAFVLETGGATAVVFGSAPDDELGRVAASLEPVRG